MIGSFRQRQLLPMMAPAAILRRIGRGDFDKHSASFFRFARELGKECRPRGICNALGKTMVVNHAAHLEVFCADDPVGIDNLTALLMGEVLSSEADAFMDTGHYLPVLASLWRTLSKFGVLTLYVGKCFFFLAKEARVRYLSAIREGGKGLQPYVNADLLRTIWQPFRLSALQRRKNALKARSIRTATFCSTCEWTVLREGRSCFSIV
jgi:hypothetical protein